MRYAIPFSIATFDTVVKKYDLCVTRRYIFKKLTQLDGEILRNCSFVHLSELYQINRQTVSVSIHYLCQQELLLNTTEGFIVSIPTYTGFIGIFTGEYHGIYRFVFKIPKTEIVYSVEIFKDTIQQPVLSKLKINSCYYLVAQIKSDRDHSFPNISNEEYYVTFIGKNLTDCYLLEEIGFRYDNNKFVSLNNKGLNS
jgi:hypothetical protein